MNREQAFKRLLDLGLTRRAASALLRRAKSSGSAVSSTVVAGCHPVTRRYYVSRA